MRMHQARAIQEIALGSMAAAYAYALYRVHKRPPIPPRVGGFTMETVDELHGRILEALHGRLTSARELAAVIGEPAGDVAQVMDVSKRAATYWTQVPGTAHPPRGSTS